MERTVVRWVTTGLTVILAATAFLVGYFYYGDTPGAPVLAATLPAVPVATAAIAAGTALPAPGSASPPTGPREPEPPRPVAVHVAGAVKVPGVHWVPATARVHDVIQAAGGPNSDGEPDALNLAAAVRDGEKIYVPTKAELADQGGVPGELGADHAPRRSSGQDASEVFAVDLNRSGTKEFETLPGIGPALAQRIVTYRQQIGGFRQVEDLLGVSGIGPKTLERLRQHLTM